MDNKTLWTGIVVVVVIILGAVLFSQDNSVVDTSETNTTSTTEQVTKTPATKPAVVKPVVVVEDFTNIFPQKGNFKCVYEEVSPSNRSTNVIYFSDGKMRAEFRPLSGTPNLMVYDGKYMYNWVEGRGTGTVSQPKSISDFPSIIPKDITSGKVLGSSSSNVSWDCNPWIKDASLVTKPSYVIFN